MKIPTEDVSAGDDVTIMIRPERLLVTPGKQPRDNQARDKQTKDAAWVSATVTESLYLGSVVLVDLDCDGTSLKASMNAEAHIAFTPGDQVTVEISAEHCRVLRS
jgi:ABC-type Fe3+/spermidine/putrescine transport system ATPase subunit